MSSKKIRSTQERVRSMFEGLLHLDPYILLLLQMITLKADGAVQCRPMISTKILLAPPAPSQVSPCWCTVQCSLQSAACSRGLGSSRSCKLSPQQMMGGGAARGLVMMQTCAGRYYLESSATTQPRTGNIWKRKTLDSEQNLNLISSDIKLSQHW